MPTLHRPHIIAIGAAAVQQRQVLRAARFVVSTPTSLLDGYVHFRRLAAADHPRALGLLVDLETNDPDAPECTAAFVIAALARQMQRRQLRSAWLIGIVSEATPDLEADARVAGCHQILSVPLSETSHTALRDLVAHPAPLLYPSPHPEALIAVEAYQRAAQRVIDALLAAAVPLWTADDVQAVLSWLTRYPPVPGTALRRQPTAQTKRGLRRLGGPHRAYERLQGIAAQWRDRYPLYSAILESFLAGYERREIVKQFVGGAFYEDSRIYACIKKLPERIAAELRLEQLTNDTPESSG